MASNNEFGRCKIENKRQSFFKIFQRADLSSENMRALPHDFVRSFSDNELSGNMKIKAKWGSSWQIEITKNPIFFLEKSGWQKFVRDNGLGNNEFATFTHERDMSFALNIFKQDGKEILKAPQSSSFLASSSRVKTEQIEEGIHSDVREEDVVVSSEMSQPVPTRAKSNGGRSYKRKLFESGKKKAEESHKTKKPLFSVGRDNNAGPSSSTSSELTIVITKAYLTYLGIKRPFARGHMPDVNKTFKIHHEDMEKSWNVKYFSKPVPCFSAGWARLAKEYPIAIGDTCKLTHIKPDEMLLVVSKPGPSSSTSSELTIVITKAYLAYLRIKSPFARVHMPDVNKTFKIHHEDMEKSWNVKYFSKPVPCFSAGWARLAKEYPIAIGDTCKLTHIKPDEMLLVVSKPTQ